ncbi:MAG: DUF4445 domain-containing protein [Methanosarcinales archaeon]|nr:DUF4445 domain-containing protein [Methanosarcinales archaeon]
MPGGKRAEFKRGVSILEAAESIDLKIESACGGQQKCGMCKVIPTGNLSKLTQDELRLLTEEEVEQGYRLACAATIQGDVTITVPVESRMREQRLQIEGIEQPVSLDPAVRKYIVELPVATLEDIRTDKERILERIKEVFGLDLEIEYGVYKQLPGAIRDGEWTVSVAVWNGKRTLSVEPGVVRHAYGVAVDVGTTKIAGYLLNLRNGEVIGKEAIVNPQIKYGEDVVSRISYATDADKNLERLQISVIDAIGQIIKDTCAEAGVETRHIYEIVVVGNTVMQHLLLGVSPKYVGRSPYCAVLGSGDFRASDIGLKANANLHTFPVIGGFVGGDHVSAILATKMNESEEMSMLMDIGTNTEIAIGNKEDMISCSCASGPAFEGFYIKHGMRASSGAIEHVEINPETFEVRYRTIEGVRPRGLCGSGLIDLLAELLKTGVMDSAGKLNPEIESNRITTNNDEVEFVVAWERETGIDSDVVITQRDIRELQSAKAAMRAGAEILMLKKGIKEADIDVFYIAGAFGSYVEPANARIIGMYPDVDLERVKIVGNAAGSGAKLALISGEERAHAEEIAKKVRYIELAAEPKFTRCYMLSHYFPFGVALTDIRR